MEQEFVDKFGRAWSLNASLNLTSIKINGKDISDYLAEGTQIGWYDVSKNSGRETQNANGDMVLNVINDKYRIDIQTRYLNSNEVIDFYSEIRKSPTMYVEFLNPFDGQTKTIHAYRGDRSIRPKMPYKDGGMIYQGPTQALIEL